MKATASKQTDTFNPVVLTVTLETQNEVDAWFAVLNSGHIDASLKRVCKTGLGDAFEALEKHSRHDLTDDLHSDLKNYFSI